MQRVVLITGSSRGLGGHAAERFAQEGWAVVVNYAHARHEAEALAERIRGNGGEVLVVQADVSDPEQVRTLFDTVYLEYGRCDALVNMAGVNRDGPVLGMAIEDWKAVIDTVLTGTFLCSQEFARRYDGEHGSIVNIGATTGITGRLNGANYCSARAGVFTLTRCLALELAPKIQVNTVTPGFIMTDEVAERYSLDDPEAKGHVLSQIPMGRIGTPEDIFQAIKFLVDGQPYATGQNFVIDGGNTML
ncbi:MAG: SDR family oxidoreductase [Propionibacteriaceae bacterium]|jgi:acetoacetyl-CoA reductase/3-oxoacyl-[acyl-carrier protein] reductase|nr:SDR family oxidoreductase [Propionibacteriaceae bacterium]